MLASFSIVPVGSGSELKEHVARVLDLIDRSGLDYRAGAMQTTVEGNMEEVMELITECHKLMRRHASRVLTSITIDDREGAGGRLSGKVSDMEKVLGRDLKHE